jgi:hypothetical protein
MHHRRSLTGRWGRIETTERAVARALRPHRSNRSPLTPSFQHAHMGVTCVNTIARWPPAAQREGADQVNTTRKRDVRSLEC